MARRVKRILIATKLSVIFAAVRRRKGNTGVKTVRLITPQTFDRASSFHIDKPEGNPYPIVEIVLLTWAKTDLAGLLRGRSI